MKNEESIKIGSTAIIRCFTHPVVQIFCDPKVKHYFEKENKKSLEFGDIQFLLCRRKPKKEKWIERWRDYFFLVNRQTGKEVYNSKEHLHKEIRKHRKRFPGVLEHFDRTYALSPNSINKAMKDFTLSRLNNHSDVLILNKVTYFGIDSSLFDERDSELFDTYINHVYKPLMKISKKKEILRHLWLRLRLKEYFKKFEQVCQELPQKDRGHFIGYVHEQLKWFIQSCDADLDSFQEFFGRLRKWGLSYGRKVWIGAEVYIKNVNKVMIKHRKELEKHIQMEFEKSVFKDTHFEIVSKALKKMVDSDIVSKKEYKWLQIQQRMSKLHLENLGENLTSRTLDKMPLIVIDTS